MVIRVAGLSACHPAGVADAGTAARRKPENAGSMPKRDCRGRLRSH